MDLLHSDTLMQVLVSSSSTCPEGHAQNPASHIIPGVGLLQVALNGLQPPTKDCPFPGQGTTVTFTLHEFLIPYSNNFSSVLIWWIGKFQRLVNFDLVEA